MMNYVQEYRIRVEKNETLWMTLNNEIFIVLNLMHIIRDFRDNIIIIIIIIIITEKVI